MHLAQHFLEHTCQDFGREPMKLTRNQVEAIRAYPWPGNVRELKNVIERAVILSQGSALRLDLSLPESRERSAHEPVAPVIVERDTVLTEKEIRQLQKQNVITALQQADWRVSGKNGAADMLGIKPTTLADRIKSLGIKKPA